MDLKDIKSTKAWGLYEKGRNYHRMQRYYDDTDKNYRFYNGNQWEGAKLGGVEPVQKNFIKPIVKYKVTSIHDNLYAINFSSQNFENKAFRKNAEDICKMLNKRAARIWEKDGMDKKGREVTKDAAINDEGIIFVRYDSENHMPVNEVLNKVDVYYGDENNSDIEAQPYILIRKRMSVLAAREMAVSKGLSEEKAKLIIGDNDTFEEAGEAAKEEVDNRVTIITKMWKEKGTVHFSTSTRWVDIEENEDSGLSMYQIAHFNWEERKGSARGEGEVRNLIPNQIEVNRTEMRRVLSVKSQAYPKKVVNESKISNPSAVDQMGTTIKVSGMSVDDVSKVITTIPPATMSSDVKQLQEDLINVTRDLAGAGEAATGNVDPESASGRAILAVQQASLAPMTEQKSTYKDFLERIARIWLEMMTVYEDSITLEKEYEDPISREMVTELIEVSRETMEALKASVKIDITPKSAFDKFAQEMSIENMFVNGMFNIQRLPELKIYVKLLDDDSTMPKMKLEEAIELMEAEQRKVAMIDAQVQMMQQRANQFLEADPDMQARQMVDARQQMEMEALQQGEAV